MKPVFPIKRSVPAAEEKVDPPAPFAPTKPADLGLIERRRSIRPLPVADAVEKDSDTAWGAFQALISDNPKD
jgi:hypothetical protein